MLLIYKVMLKKISCSMKVVQELAAIDERWLKIYPRECTSAETIWSPISDGIVLYFREQRRS
jgi:hypothetical protein